MASKPHLTLQIAKRFYNLTTADLDELRAAEGGTIRVLGDVALHGDPLFQMCLAAAKSAVIIEP